MYGLWIKRGLVSDSINELIDKLEKITDNIRCNRDKYAAGEDVDTGDADFGWAVLSTTPGDDFESSDMDWLLDEDDDDDFADEDDDSDIYDEDEEDF